jgi:hypothetical protein
LQVGDIDGAARAGRLGFGFLRVDERHDCIEVGARQPKCRHAFIDASVADHGTKPVAADVVAHERRAREVRTGLAAHRVAPVAEAALRGEDALSRLQLLGRNRLPRGLSRLPRGLSRLLRGLSRLLRGRRGLQQHDNGE